MCRAGGRRCNGSSSHRSAATARQRRSRANRALRNAQTTGSPDAIAAARQRLADLTGDTVNQHNTADHGGDVTRNQPSHEVDAIRRNADQQRAMLAHLRELRAATDSTPAAAPPVAAQHAPTASTPAAPHQEQHHQVNPPPGDVTTFDTPSGRVTNVARGQNHGLQTDAVNGDITFGGPGRGFTISANTAGAQRDVTPPATRHTPRPTTAAGTGPVEITDSTGHPLVQAGRVDGGVWIDGKRVSEPHSPRSPRGRDHTTGHHTTTERTTVDNDRETNTAAQSMDMPAADTNAANQGGNTTVSVRVQGHCPNGHLVFHNIPVTGGGHGLATANADCPACGQLVHLTGSF